MAHLVHPICWIDGRLEPLDRPVVRADDSAAGTGRGCYTTVRVSGGRPRFADRHALRLQRDARQLQIGEIEPSEVLCALRELSAAALPGGDGVVRLQASRDGEGRPHLLGIPRASGVEAPEWRAIVSAFAHQGPSPYSGAKVTSRLLHEIAAEAARDAGAQEALMFDIAGRLVEGSRSNLFVDAGGGALRTPPLARGPVRGIARDVVLERIAGAGERDVSKAELLEAREIVAVNAVRGARPITALDGRAVGDGRRGPWAERLSEALADD